MVKALIDHKFRHGVRVFSDVLAPNQLHIPVVPRKENYIRLGWSAQDLLDFGVRTLEDTGDEKG